MGRWVTGSENLSDLWALSFDETEFLKQKPRNAQLDYAIRLKFYTLYGRLPRRTDHLPDNVINYVADQVDSPDTFWPALPDRTVYRRNAEIKKFVSFLPLTGKQEAKFLNWFHSQPNFMDMPSDNIEANIRRWCTSNKTEPPSQREIDRLIDTIHFKFEKAECVRIQNYLTEESQKRLLASIGSVPGLPSLLELRADPGRVGRDNFNLMCEKLKFIADMNLPVGYILSVNEDWRNKVVRRIARSKLDEIQRMTDERCVGMYAVYLVNRLPDMTDALITMLIDSVHKIETKTIRTITKMVSKHAHHVYNREKLLLDILTAVLENPDETAADIIFPLISPQEAEAYIEKQKSRNNWAIDVFNEMHGSWRTHYRPMLKNLLDTVEFGSTVSKYRPLLDALNWINVNFDRRSRIPVRDREIPIDGVVPNKYIKAVIRGDYIDKMSYELCAIMTLREKLATREIWVPGSEKFKNPENDIPEDFEEHRLEYYQGLNLDLDAKTFIASLKDELKTHLLEFDQGFARNKLVRINHTTRNYSFKLTPLEALPEPAGLSQVKAEIAARWPMTSLLDMMKEAALDTGFTRAFQSIGTRQNMDQATLNKRLIVSLYGLGTNAGLKRISAASNDVTYEQLRHIRRRFIDAGSIREANRILVNSILGIRDPSIWGEMGTAVASDSKQFKAWDRNPMTEKHLRYGDSGVMAYWHVEGRSTCIYSQLKRVSSRETASMIEGVLNHCSDMAVDTAYVDSHGQTEVAFAFSRLLGFDLAPRIKRIGHSKLYAPTEAFKDRLPNIGQMIIRPVNWQRIARYYDDMVKYATAMKTGTTSPEIVLRRFSRNNYQHPTYKALSELGRVIKTIFVCRYLKSEAFRREIQEGLNVVENWNSATNFVYFGRGGEITSNRREDQEIAIQTLHLLQNCMVYVNTHMFQDVLADQEWRKLMKNEDYRGITPLIYNHVNPYGRFELSLQDRMFS